MKYKLFRTDEIYFKQQKMKGATAGLSNNHVITAHRFCSNTPDYC